MEEEAGRYRVSERAVQKFDLDLGIEKGPTVEPVGPSHLNGVGLTTSA